jgi:hypothetical protein
MAIIFGIGGDDRLIGTEGNDALYGRPGDDTLIGGAGDDYLDGDRWAEGHDGFGYDRLIGGAGADILYGSGLEDFLSGGSGTDVLDGGSGSDTLDGGSGADTLHGGSGADILKGAGGDDTLVWWDPAIRLVDGGRGTDRLDVYHLDLDMRDVDNDKLADIEVIDMGAGYGQGTLTLTKADILAISSTTDKLKVLGEQGDAVNIVGRFKDLGVSGDFHRYKLGDAMLLVDTDISAVH